MWEVPTAPPKRRFFQKPHGITSQKTPFFSVYLVSEFLAPPGMKHLPLCKALTVLPITYILGGMATDALKQATCCRN
jgi:hypothetical protein